MKTKVELMLAALFLVVSLLGCTGFESGKLGRLPASLPKVQQSGGPSVGPSQPNGGNSGKEAPVEGSPSTPGASPTPAATPVPTPAPTPKYCKDDEAPIPDRPGECGKVLTVIFGNQHGSTGSRDSYHCGSNFDALDRCLPHDLREEGLREYLMGCYDNYAELGTCIAGYNCPDDTASYGSGDLCKLGKWDAMAEPPVPARCVEDGEVASSSCLPMPSN